MRYAVRVALGITFFLQVAFSHNAARAETPIVISPEIRHQHMDGFGAALSWYLSRIYRGDEERKATINQLMFENLGLDILRLKNWYFPDDADSDSAMDSHGLNQQFYAAAKAGNPDIKILYSSWSPPDALKSNGERRNGGTLARDSEGNFLYGALADYWVEVLDHLGWTPDYLSFQNEPGWVASWETCEFSTYETSSLAGYAEAADAIWDAIKDRPDVPKMVGSEAENMPAFFDLNQAVLERPYFAVHGYHVYDIGNPGQIDSSTTINRLRRIRDDFGDRPNWQTEFSNGFGWIDAARVIHNTLAEANASAYIYWKLAWEPSNDTMIAFESSGDYTVEPHYYTVKHYSRHIHQGYQRIDVGGSSTDVRVSGFLSPEEDHITLVAINSSGAQEKIVLAHDDLMIGNISGYQSVVGDFYQAMSGVDAEDPIVLPASSITTIILALDLNALTYDANGATGGQVPVHEGAPYEIGDIVTVLGNTGDLLRTGYTFSGWNTAADGSGESYVEGDTISIEAPTTLYAQWTANTYAVTLNPQGGEGGSDGVMVTFGAPMPPASAPVRDGYIFGGYFSKTGGRGVLYYDADMSSARDWSLADDTTLYAAWSLGVGVAGVDGVVGIRQENARGLGYYVDDTTDTNLAGVTGSNDTLTRRCKVPIARFELPSLPPGQKLAAVNIHYQITASRDHDESGFDAHVYLLDFDDPSQTGTNFYFHGGIDPNDDVRFVGASTIPHDAGENTTHDPPLTFSVPLDGAALDLFESFYDGNEPLQSHAYFRFNRSIPSWEGLGSTALNRFFIGIEPEVLRIEITTVADHSADYQNWLIEHYGDPDYDDTQLAASGVHTIREAFIAGLNPTNATERFVMQDIEMDRGGRVLRWSGVEGRSYNVYWTSNLVHGVGFERIGSNIPWNVGAYTDTVHRTSSKSFYRISAELED